MEAVKLAIQEGLEEALQEIVSMTTPAIHGRELPSLEQYVKQAGRAGLGGAIAGAFLGVGSGAMINISDRLEAKLEGHAYDRKLKIQSPRKFKEFALSKEGSELIAAMSPEVAAEIAAKEQPSRGDLKKLGVTGWNTEERKQLSALFRDALADQERMAYNQRAVEQFQESAARTQREAEQGLGRITVVTAVPLADSERTRLIEKMAAKTGLRIVLEEKIDESILGGMIVILYDEIIDGSVRHGLDLVKEQLDKVRVH